MINEWTVTITAAIAAFSLWTWCAYSYGVKVENTRNLAAQVPEYQAALDAIVKAKKDAAAAYAAQVENAEKYAKDLKESMGKVTIITKEVPKYVAANPSPTACDLDDFLLSTFNQAIERSNAETIRPH